MTEDLLVIFVFKMIVPLTKFFQCTVIECLLIVLYKLFSVGRFKRNKQIISSKTIEACIDTGEAYRIIADGKIVGGAVIKVTGTHGDLELLFIKPEVHSKGIGYAAWCEIEKLHPEITVWETITPYFEKRNIHFYVNRCGFHIVEYFNEHHCTPDDTEGKLFDMFRFRKI